MEMIICPRHWTGYTCVLRYDEHGYEFLVDGQVMLSHRLEPICYLVSPRDRERIALIHGLQDVGEPRLARVVAAQPYHSEIPSS